MIGELVYLGFSRAHTPLDIRERIHGDAQSAGRLISALRAAAPERLFLHTCERVELYAWATHCDIDAWLTAWAETCAATPAELRAHCRHRRGAEVVNHLLRVAAGLDSRLLGEDPIQGQVRQAYLHAAERRWIGPILAALGRAAIQTGKRVRRSVPAFGHPPSAATLAADHLRPLGPSLAGRRVLIVGAGHLAADVSRTLVGRGATDVFMTSRGLDRARRLAAETGARTCAYGTLADEWHTFSAVITCAAAPGYLLDASMCPRHLAEKVHLVDLGVPRNIDPALGLRPGCRLVHLEQLSPDCRATVAARHAAERIVATEVERYLHWLAGRGVSAEVARLARTPGVSRAERHARIMRLKAQVAA